MVVGFAESVHVGAGVCCVVTVTESEQCTVPPGPVAVIVYVVSDIGVTDFEPPATGVTAPILLSIDAPVAFVVVQVSVEEPPFVTECGFAVSVQVGAGVVTVTVIVALQWTVPPLPIAVPV